MKANDLKFLRQLAKNNDRDWFQKNRPAFDQAQENFLGLVVSLIYTIGDFDESVAGVEPKSCLFRIYRDVRFSKNKAPYKNHLAAFICAGGRKSDTMPGYYIHIEPGGKSIFGSGIYMPEKTILHKLRIDVASQGSQIAKMLTNKKFRRIFTEISNDDAAKTVPRGFDKNHSRSDMLKWRHFFVHECLSDATVMSQKLLSHLTSGAKMLAEWNQMLLDLAH